MGKASRKKASIRSLDVLNNAITTIQSVTGNKEIRFRFNELPQEEKISNALATILDTEVPDGSPLDEYQAALGFVVIAWNISLMDADKQSDALAKLIRPSDRADDATHREALEQIERLIIKKQVLYPDDRRTVVSWDAQWKGDYLHVTAAALAAALAAPAT